MVVHHADDLDLVAGSADLAGQGGSECREAALSGRIRAEKPECRHVGPCLLGSRRGGARLIVGGGFTFTPDLRWLTSWGHVVRWSYRGMDQTARDEGRVPCGSACSPRSPIAPRRTTTDPGSSWRPRWPRASSPVATT